MTKYLLRSLMFVPGHIPKFMDSASKSSADVLLLDVEDSVQPVSNKIKSRNLIVKHVKAGKFKNHLVFPRINDSESGLLLKDLMALTIPGVDGFMYPKATKGSDIYFFDKLLETIEYEKGIEIGTFKIIPLIENTGAVLNVQDICKASNRVIAIAFGAGDFISDLDGIHDSENMSYLIPRANIAMAARESGVIPIDTVHLNIHDYEHLEKNLKLAKILGFEGMLVLHPKELEYVHKYFSPSKEEVEEAELMLRLAKEAESKNQGVAILNDRFVGPPLVEKAKKILEKHKMIKNK